MEAAALGKAAGEVATTFAGDRLLRLPGPSPVPERVVRAMARPMVGHRSAGFQALLRRVVAGLKRLFETEEGDVHVFAGSGTLAMESAVANLLEPGESCLVATAGKFGERWVEIAQAFGVRPIVVEFPYGTRIDPRTVAEALDRHPEARVLFVTQNESSTAVYNDVEALAREARSRGRLIVVDAVSSLGGAPLSVDKWGLDVVVSGSQKCLMLPPGLAFAAVGPRAREWSQRRRGAPRYYVDWRRYSRSFLTGETPYTPAVSLLFGLEEALAIMEEEGKKARLARHRLMREMVRAGLNALGFTLLVDEDAASWTVTAARWPEGDVEALRKVVRQETGVVLSGGQGSLAGQIFRVGHMGAATPMDMVATLSAIELGLTRLGAAPRAGAGAAAAMEVWRSWA